jgi:predicted dehydrogenase
VFQNRRWDSDFLSLREIVHQEKLGPIYRFESAIERFRPKLRGTWRESGAPENLPGMLYDLGSHLVDQAVLLFGPAERVFADARALREGATSDDVTYLHIQHVSGVMTEVSANTVSAISAPRFRLLGLNGALQIEGFDSQEETLRSGVIPRSTTWSPETRTMRMVTETNDELVELHHGRWDAFYPAVRDSIIHDTPAPVSTESVLETMKVLDALHKSALTKEWVAL